MKAMGLSRCQWKLLEELGDAYCASCIYRDYGNHDLEICGGRTTHAPIHVFVWQKKPHMEIVERFLDLPHDCKQLVELLCQLTQKYDIQEGGYKPCVRQ